MASPAYPPSATRLLDILENSLHASKSEWLFLRELRVSTGRRNGSGQRLDAFALNTLPHQAMKRVCYEIKISRADFLCEMRQPLKRRIGMRYSNEFYFVTPANLLAPNEVPVEAGLVEAGYATPEEWRDIIARQNGFFHYDPDTRAYCLITVPAPWRDTPGPTWQFTAAMVRNQQFASNPARAQRATQERLPFE
jgi:hypothetical protein